MVRRRLTLKRIDPWSVLKFGFVANLSLLAIGLLGAGVVWFFIQRLQLITKVCEIATEMGFVECGVNGGNLFRAVLLLGLLGVVIQTGLVVFLAFLYNLIADLVGGLTFSFVDDTPGAAARGETAATSGPAKTISTAKGGAQLSEDKDRTIASPAARPDPKPVSTSAGNATTQQATRPSPSQTGSGGSGGSGSSGSATTRSNSAPGSTGGTTPGGTTGSMWGDRPSGANPTAPQQRPDGGNGGNGGSTGSTR